jgi:ATP-dependent protease ClpP protease subunit
MKPKGNDRFWNGAERPKSKREFFNAVTTPAPTGEGATVATIRMYGPIDSWGGWWGISTKDVGQVLDALPESVEQIVLRINSPGGECFEAVAILNMLRAHKAKVLAVVDGLAASAASVIASGCDETVMSPGTQMMIHKPSVISWGDAEDLRKDASILDTIETSIIDIYAAKAGTKDWAQLLADETWMTASETVALGLADREAVIPDAGEAATVGDEQVIVIVPDEDADDASAHIPLRDWAAAHAIQTPVSTEPVDNNGKEGVMSDALKSGLIERLGLTDAAASDDAVLAAVDELLDTATTPPTPTATAPQGTVLVDAEQFANLQASAALGVQAHEAQVTARREGIVDTAIAEGRIAPTARKAWLDQLGKDEAGAAALIQSMPKNTIPVTELGVSDDVISDDDRLLVAAGWVQEKKGA